MATLAPVLGSGALFSECCTWRWVLTRRWAELPPLVFVGLNPSTADAKQDDPTIRRVMGFADAFGCGGLLMLNAFAYRSTDPRELLRTPADISGPENDAWLARAFRRAAEKQWLVVFGWGAHCEPWRAERIASFLRGPAWCLGRTKSGAPKHPLYLRADTRIESWTPPT